MSDTSQPTPDQLRRYASDFLAFAEDLTIPAAHGPARFGDVMAGFQRERFGALAPALQAIVIGEKPPTGRFWWEATKGASKDSDLAVALLWLMAFATRPLGCQVGAADQDQADELRKAARDIVALNEWLSARIEIQVKRILCEPTGAICDIVAADVAGSHGARPSVLILNELSHLQKKEFAANLLDNAAKVPRGLVVIATNAGFSSSWQTKWRDIARTSDRWVFHKFSRPAPWIEEAELEEARLRNSTSRYRRLWQGIWSSGGGDAIDPTDIAAAVTLPGPTFAPRSECLYAGGLDLGIKHDHTALVIVGVEPGSGRVQLAHAQSWQPGSAGRVDLEAVERGVLDAHKRYGLSVVRYDPHQAQLMAQRLARKGVPMAEHVFAGRNLDTMAVKLLEAFRGRLIDLYDHKALIRDLGLLTIVEKSFGHKLTAPSTEDGHADLGFALAIILPAALTIASRLGLRGQNKVIITDDSGPVAYAGQHTPREPIFT